MVRLWVPLPPRDTYGTSRQQRRHARTILEEKGTPASGSGLADETRTSKLSSHKNNNGDVDSNNNISTSTAKNSTVRQIPAAQRKPNRPGMNSYLKVLLDDTTMDHLHVMAKSIQTKVQFLPAPSSSDATLEQSKTKRNQQPLRFKPRSRASLHMTFFFGGEALGELPVQELEDWYGTVRDRLGQAGFHTVASCTREDETNDNNQPQAAVDSSSVDPGDDGMDGEYWSNALSISLFPPKRNNLVVAILEVSPAWHTLHNDVRNIAKNGDSQGLKDVTAYSKDKWTAHITLGNIVGGGTKGEVRKAFDEVLRQVAQDLAVLQDGNGDHNNESEQLETKNRPTGVSSVQNCLFKARTRGIAMGGPVPDQAELDWDFRYEPRNAL